MKRVIRIALVLFSLQTTTAGQSPAEKAAALLRRDVRERIGQPYSM